MLAANSQGNAANSGAAITLIIGQTGALLAQYTLISFVLMAAFGAVAAHLMEAEKAPEIARDFKRFTTRLFVTTFTCVLLWAGCDYQQIPLAPGLIACGVVAVWPKQILEYALGALKAILDALLRKEGKK